MSARIQPGVLCGAAVALLCAYVVVVHGQGGGAAAAQNRTTEYAIKVMPPGGPPPRLPDGHVDLSGHWLPNSAGQGVSGRDGVDPAARQQFDPRATPEEKPAFQPWAEAKIKAEAKVEADKAAATMARLKDEGEAAERSLRLEQPERQRLQVALTSLGT